MICATNLLDLAAANYLSSMAVTVTESSSKLIAKVLERSRRFAAPQLLFFAGFMCTCQAANSFENSIQFRIISCWRTWSNDLYSIFASVHNILRVHCYCCCLLLVWPGMHARLYSRSMNFSLGAPTNYFTRTMRWKFYELHGCSILFFA